MTHYVFCGTSKSVDYSLAAHNKCMRYSRIRLHEVNISIKAKAQLPDGTN